MTWYPDILSLTRTAPSPCPTAPNVDSALVRFRLKRSDQLPDLGRTPAQFLALVNLAFSSRRKMLKNNLRAAYRAEVVDGAIAQVGRRRGTGGAALKEPTSVPVTVASAGHGVAIAGGAGGGCSATGVVSGGFCAAEQGAGEWGGCGGRGGPGGCRWE